ncbi:MAG: ADP-ribose pyrophosphatase YjhB (NUDIX family) [Psychrobacter glaciei]|jgi:ADP-ribose pyrophosphatase YjhB (NUDIX family)
MKFCSDCGHPVKYSIPEGDNLKRAVCTQCSTIHYQNPRIIAGTLPVYENKILLCKRAIEPRLGYWTLPAGFMEEQESLEQGAVRETLEEAGIVVECGTLLTSVSVPFISQVHIFFLAKMTSPEHASQTTESLEVKLFDFDQIPWDQIAFPTVKKTIKHFLDDHNNGELKTRIFDIHPSERIREVSKAAMKK